MIVGERLRLRPPHLGDIDLRHRWFSDPEVTRYLKLYERLGFRHDGRERAAVRLGDTYLDKLLMSMLASEWAEMR